MKPLSIYQIQGIVTKTQCDIVLTHGVPCNNYDIAKAIHDALPDTPTLEEFEKILPKENQKDIYPNFGANLLFNDGWNSCRTQALENYKEYLKNELSKMW